uniref:Uncharacterized protein n=1 Tax=Chenopodium quinoa TaxID=63459 RepID=A0A803MZ89_CHEQI
MQEDTNLIEDKEDAKDSTMLLALKIEDKRDDNCTWYLDNGASNHMTGDKNKFVDLDTAVTGNVTFGDGSKVKIEGKGITMIELKDSSHKLIPDVYYIPNLRSNISSVGQLLKVNGCKIIMEGQKLWLRDRYSKLIAIVSMTKNRMFLINLLQTIKPMCLKTCIEDPSWKWHMRFGHLTFEGLKELGHKKMEAWSGWKPSVSHLRVFGSIAYAQVPKQLRSKLGDRSKKLLFIGYDEKSKGYKLFNPNTNNSVISRYVEFDEEATWDWSIEEEESYNFLPYFEEENSTQHVSAPTTPPSSPQMLSPSLHLNGDSTDSRIEVTQSDEGIFISQEAYTKGVLKKFNMLNVNPVSTPMECGVKLSKNDPYGQKVNPTLFKSLVGSLRYLTCTRPDILFVVGLVSRFMENPSTLHLNTAKRIFRYLKGTLDHGLLYSTSHDFKLWGYCDSDFVGDIDDRKSTTCFVFLLENNVVSWSSKKQPIVTLSTCESEYIVATSCACHSIWIRRLLKELQLPQKEPTEIMTDNKSALALAKNPVFHD